MSSSWNKVSHRQPACSVKMFYNSSSMHSSMPAPVMVDFPLRGAWIAPPKHPVRASPATGRTRWASDTPTILSVSMRTVAAGAFTAPAYCVISFSAFLYRLAMGGGSRFTRPQMGGGTGAGWLAGARPRPPRQRYRCNAQERPRFQFQSTIRYPRPDGQLHHGRKPGRVRCLCPCANRLDQGCCWR